MGAHPSKNAIAGTDKNWQRGHAAGGLRGESSRCCGNDPSQKRRIKGGSNGGSEPNRTRIFITQAASNRRLRASLRGSIEPNVSLVFEAPGRAPSPRSDPRNRAALSRACAEPVPTERNHGKHRFTRKRESRHKISLKHTRGDTRATLGMALRNHGWRVLLR
jgi:hypothetical protein